MSTNKSTSLSVSNIPRFNGKNFQGWSEKMIGIFMIAKVYGVITGDTVEPAEDSRPQEPTPPDAITNQTEPAVITQLNALWNQYNVPLISYNQQMNVYERKMSSWNDSNSQAMEIFNQALDIGIWDQVKVKTAKETWDWLKDKYAKSLHLEIMEHFWFLKDQKINLSNPNPQLTTFMHHYQALPADMISSAMASLILLSNLPLTTNPGVKSVYQHMLESTFKAETAATLKLEDVIQQICDVWAARFGGFPSNQQPRKGTVYDKGKAPANQQPKQKQQVQVQQNTAIKGKGPNPSYSGQQSTDKGSSQNKRKRPLRRGGKAKGAHSHMAGAPDNFNSDFVLASSAMHITDTPAIPAPTTHTVASFTAAGPWIRCEKTTGPWKNPGRSTPPYPHVQCSRNLMSRLGVTPTIQTSKEFEGIASLEEVVDEAAGAPTIKLGTYALSDLPRAPMPEMAPLLDRMVIDVPSDNEGDMVSLGDEGDIVPVDSNLFGLPIP